MVRQLQRKLQRQLEKKLKKVNHMSHILLFHES